MTPNLSRYLNLFHSSIFAGVCLFLGCNQLAAQTLQAEWLLQGDAADHLGVSDGTATGVQWVNAYINGSPRTVASFNDFSSILVPKTASLNLPATGYSLMGWVKSPDFSSAPAPNAYFTLFRAGGIPNQSESAYSFRFSSQGLSFQVSSLNNYPNFDPGYRDIKWISPGATSSADSHLLDANQWYHIAVTYDGHTFAAYLNGTSLSATESPITPLDLVAPYDFAGNLRIGTPHAVGAYDPQFNGQISDVRIYSGALSSLEIQQIVQAVPEPSGTVLVLCFAAIASRSRLCHKRV